MDHDPLDLLPLWTLFLGACLVGWLALRDPLLAEQARGLVLLYEGLHTYGGMAGRDMEAIAVGIAESVAENHIRARVAQVEYLGSRLDEAGVPIVRPTGGHCVCIDAAAALPHLRRTEFPAQTLACAVYLEAGIRGVEESWSTLQDTATDLLVIACSGYSERALSLIGSLPDMDMVDVLAEKIGKASSQPVAEVVVKA